MRIFISYGHDANAKLVHRIRERLHAEHETWIDEAEIKFTQEWRREITTAILDSDWVLAFYSRHSTRNPGVCLDELAIALHHKGGAIAPILVEPLDQVNPPATLTHIQWLDMSNWAAQDDAWFEEKITALLAHFRDPASQRFPGEIDELTRRLQPIQQAADIAPLIEEFTGRNGLLQHIDTWRAASDRGLFWLHGAPGTGKSAFAARTAHFGHAHTIGLALAHYNFDDRRDPSRIVRTLAFHLAIRLGGYRATLLHRLRNDDPDGAAMAGKPVGDLCDWLIVQPLATEIDRNRVEHRLIAIIDALDETTAPDGRCILAEVLAQAAPRLQKGIGLLVTSRTEFAPAAQLRSFPNLELGTRAEDRTDLETYARAWLQQRGLQGQALETMVRRVADASQPHFLYLRKLRDAVELGEIELGDGNDLPSDLAALYTRWFHHRFPGAAAYDRALPLLEVLLAAERPVPEPILTALFGWTARQRSHALDITLRSLFERRPDGVAPFHKSLRDWLLDERQSGPPFVVDPAAGHARLAQRLAEDFLTWTPTPGAPLPAPFLLFELPRLLTHPNGAPARTHLTATGDPPPPMLEAARIAQRLALAYDWPRARDWWRLTIELGQSGDPATQAWCAYASTNLGDLERTVGNLASARLAYDQGMTIHARLAATDPANTDWQRDLSISHDKIGDALAAQGDQTAALIAFRNGMNIAERLTATDPANTDWQRDLSVIHNRIGEVLAAQDDRPAAIIAFRADMAIAERLAATDPANAVWQRDLFVSLCKLTTTLMQDGPSADARTTAKRLVAQAAHLHASFPQDRQREDYVRAATALQRAASRQNPP